MTNSSSLDWLPVWRPWSAAPYHMTNSEFPVDQTEVIYAQYQPCIEAGICNDFFQWVKITQR